MMVKLFIKILVMTIILCWANQAQASLFINEVMMDPSVVADTDGEWFELYNNGDGSVNINGWIIKDADSNYHVINNGGPLTVPAKGYLVLGRNGDPTANGGYIPDYVYSSFVLANSEDEIILEDSASEVSRIDYSLFASWPVHEGRSMAYSGSGDVNDPNSWFATPQESYYIFGAGDYGTPGGPNVMPEPATLVLVSSGLLSFLITIKKKST